MPATYEPCPACQGLGHVCKDEDPTGHIHDHDPAAPLCKRCAGRGLVPIKPAAPAPAPEE